eukprot:COSAG06_NODE_12392_length_1388_cov_1.143522_1_plen_56_part_10
MGAAACAGAGGCWLATAAGLPATDIMMLELVSVLVVVGGAASSTVAVPDSACQAKL